MQIRLFVPKKGKPILQHREIEQVTDLCDGYGGQQVTWSDWEDVPIVYEGEDDKQN